MLARMVAGFKINWKPKQCGNGTVFDDYRKRREERKEEERTYKKRMARRPERPFLNKCEQFMDENSRANNCKDVEKSTILNKGAGRD